MTNNYCQKHKEDSQKKHVKDNKILMKKNKSKGKKRPKKDLTKKDKEKKLQYHCEHDKNLSEEQNQRLVEYGRNYYLTHNKYV